MKRTRVIAATALVGLFCAGFLGVRAWALSLGDLAKVGGIGFLVSQYDTQIDSFITKQLDEQNAAALGATKVVPILSLGRGGYIGAAQVVGNPDNVNQVKAVFQVEGKIGSFRPKVLIPATTDKATGNVDRAKGVGVSAVIEFRI